ncbi:MAG: hypothetical protein PHU40_05345 [Sulfurimonas sp.]|nr:hypothetical protein [Sulfurimonas sp.]
MKKILLIVLFTLTLFANTDSCKLDVYFGNGVWNDEDQADISKIALKTFLQQQNPQRFNIADEGVTYNFKYAHNETYGNIDDLLETFWQLHESGQVGDFYFGFVARVLDAANVLSYEEESFRDRMAVIAANYDVNTQKMLEKYKTQSFSQKHNVLLVAHSQGNLFGNKMYELLDDQEKQKFRMVSVATPANHISGGEDYITLDLDLIIKAIPGSLPSNASGFGHTFVESYLNESNTGSRTMINTGITKAVEILDQNMCATYKYFRLIGFICSSRIDQELVVDIYGTKKDYSEELVATDTKERIALNTNGYCPLTGDDYTTNISKYNTGNCMAYRIDDTSYQPLESFINRSYENSYPCVTYTMKGEIVTKLKDLQE